MGDVRILKLADGTTKEVPLSPNKLEKERQALTSTDGRTQRANARRAEIINLVRKGYRPEEACREIGIAMKTYYQYRSDLPSFRTQVDLVRQQWQNEQAESDKGSTWDSFVSFRKRFFRFDTYWHQIQIADAIESAPEMGVTLILVPPEMGKTTVLEDKICETLAKDPNRRIAYISEGSGHSRKVGSRIRRRMTDTVDFGDYIARYGPFYEDGQEKHGKVWTAERFLVFKSSHDERDYSFEARGSRSNIQGSRVDDLYLDDIQSLKSLTQTQFLLGQFRQEWITRLGKRGRCVIVGNRIGNNDFYDALIDADLVDRLVELPAVDEEGMTLCPELWPQDKLMLRKKQVGEEVWARTYMQNPIAAGAVTFTPDVREAVKDYHRTITKKPGIATVMSLDPALGGGNSLTVSQLTPSKLEVVDQVTDYGLGRTEEILERVDQFAALYRPTDLIIEMMAFQQALGKDDRMLEMARRYGFRIYPHTTTGNKFDPSFGVGSMASAMRAGELTIPWGDDQAQETFQPLLDEMEKWRPYVRGVKLKQDRIMSLWFIYLYWTQLRELLLHEEKKESIKVRGLPWRPTQLRAVK